MNGPSSSRPCQSHAEYVRHVEAGADRLRAVLATCAPTARVPSCPGWTATDLVAHHARVVHLWATFVERRPVGPDDLDEPDLPRGFAARLDFHREHSARLVEALGLAAPGETCWTWSSDRSVGFVARRQAHEALIHRVDAEQTAGVSTPLDPGLATDGVREVLEVMYGAQMARGRSGGTRGHLRFDLTDTGTSIGVETGWITGAGGEQPRATAARARSTRPLVVVRASAGTMDSWLWRRTDDSAIDITGDPSAVRALRDRVARPF